jgi:3-deoxy-7-phosphoheptulonate synthase
VPDVACTTGPAALQQPSWDDGTGVQQVRDELAALPPLVDANDVRTLRSALADVAAGRAKVVQAGDCAEDPTECTAGDVARKAGLLDRLAGTLKMNVHRPVLRVGRIAGQFAKPRSKPTEDVDGVTLPAFRGHMVNRPEPDALLRRPDPRRMIDGYHASASAMTHLGWLGRARHAPIEAPVWTSHEALLLDYELPQVRRVDDELLLTSTHWPWIGDRTRALDGAHVDVLSQVANPVACKVGPSMTPEELVDLCERLDPERTHGRLTLIVRLGTDRLPEQLPTLVEAVRAAGHPVIWMVDPMHGNTVKTSCGLKTRHVETIIREMGLFQRVLQDLGAIPGGMHLETTPDAVTECAWDPSDDDRVGDKYTSFCDPRLNPDQAAAALSTWSC